jgi:thiamine biosynthesis lipoprotein
VSPELAQLDEMRSYRFAAMGTDVHVVLPEASGEAITPLRELFASWEATLSRFRPNSELSRLNARSGEPVVVSPVLFEVVSASVEGARATDGAFDPTLLRQLVRIGYSEPFDQMHHDATPVAGFCVRGGGWQWIELDRRSRTITVPIGSALDFGGIAKGMAVDAALELLDRRGDTPALVCAGGDLSVRGLPVRHRSWPVLVGDDPAGQVVALVRGALATSGIARRSWLQGGRRRHHLIDPATGESAENELREVTVAAENCRTAEVAATAAFVLGADLGSELLARKRLAGRFAYRDGAQSTVGAWPSLLPDAA